MIQKGLAPVLIILLLALVAVGYFSFTTYSQNSPKTSYSNQATEPAPSSAETANWKTYTNNTFGFSLKYPASLTGYLSKTKTGVNIDYPGESDVSLFSVDVYQTNRAPIEWWNQAGKQHYAFLFNTAFNQVAIPLGRGQDKSYSELKATEVLGQRKTPGGATLSVSLLLVIHNDKIFVIWNNAKDLNSTNPQEDWTKIISTFKFTP